MQRYRATPTDAIKSVFLSPQELRDTTSKQLSKRATRLTQTYDLTRDELDELSRQRRLVSNREAARHSRLAHKEYVRELEEENAVLRYRLDLLKKEKEEKEHEVVHPLITQYHQQQPTTTASPVSQEHQNNMMIMDNGDCLMFSSCSDDFETLSF